MNMEHRLVRRLVEVAVLTVCLGLEACGGGSGGGGTPAPPAQDANAATPNFVGTWAVRTQFVSATANCSAVVGQTVDGQLVITKNGNTYSVTDGSIVRRLFVTGNTATFSYSALGVTQVWRFVVYNSDTLLFGSVEVTHSQCQAEMSVVGSRTAPAQIAPDPVMSIVSDEEHETGSGGGDRIRVVILVDETSTDAPRGLLDGIASEFQAG